MIPNPMLTSSPNSNFPVLAEMATTITHHKAKATTWPTMSGLNKLLGLISIFIFISVNAEQKWRRSRALAALVRPDSMSIIQREDSSLGKREELLLIGDSQSLSQILLGLTGRLQATRTGHKDNAFLFQGIYLSL